MTLGISCKKGGVSNTDEKWWVEQEMDNHGYRATFG